MFQKVQIPVLGIVENMNSLICMKCGEQNPIFGKGGAEDLARNNKVPLLGGVPLDPVIMEGSEKGQPVPVVNNSSIIAKIYSEIAEKISNQLF